MKPIRWNGSGRLNLINYKIEMAGFLESGVQKAGSLPLSCPPPLFNYTANYVVYPKTPVGEK